jgi:3-hydroxypropanoate dehydrogenase
MSAHFNGEAAIDLLFRDARTHNRWTDRPVGPSLLERAYTLAALGPTSMNCQPARFVFLTGSASKARLLPALAPMNVEKTRGAPVTAIIATDKRFYDQLPRMFPHAPAAREMYVANADLARATAFRNGSLTGGYFTLALRALGLDCGAMSGFNADQVDAEFFPDGLWQVNFLLNIGYGDGSELFPRQPRLPTAEACVFL